MSNKIVVHVEDHSPEVLAALRNAIERGLAAVGEKVVTHAKDNIESQRAVDTGRLRNSITYATQGTDGQTIKFTKADQKAGRKETSETVRVSEENVVYIGTNVFYAPYIECGTGQYATTGGGTPKPSWVYQDEFGQWHRAYPQPARPFLKPAVADHKKEYFDTLKQSLENA